MSLFQQQITLESSRHSHLEVDLSLQGLTSTPHWDVLSVSPPPRAQKRVHPFLVEMAHELERRTNALLTLIDSALNTVDETLFSVSEEQTTLESPRHADLEVDPWIEALT